MSQKLLASTLIIIVLLFATQCGFVSRRNEPSNQPQQQNLHGPGNSFAEKSYANAEGKIMRYLLFVPKDYDAKKKYPLILWLHGAGSRGDDLNLLLKGGDKSGIGFLAKADVQSQYPSFIVAPQLPSKSFWAMPKSPEPTVELKLALDILNKVRDDYSIDDARLYVMGISMGGFGTWDLIARHPNTFAAAVPVCGGGNETKASSLVNTPIWAFHGNKDDTVPVEESRRMIEAIRKAGGKPKYTEYEGVGHNSWENAFKEPDLLNWLFAQRLNVK